MMGDDGEQREVTPTRTLCCDCKHWTCQNPTLCCICKFLHASKPCSCFCLDKMDCFIVSQSQYRQPKNTRPLKKLCRCFIQEAKHYANLSGQGRLVSAVQRQRANTSSKHVRDTHLSRCGRPANCVGETLLDFPHTLISTVQHALVPLGVQQLGARIQPHCFAQRPHL